MAAEEEVISGQTWDAFCDSLKQAGRQIQGAKTPDSALDRAEGYRYLTRLLRIGLEMHLEFADRDFPGFFAPSDETSKIGADNPDNLYLMGRINGEHEYAIRGNRGSVAYLSFGTQKGGYETDGKMEQTGFLDAADLQCDADGNFEVLLSTQKKGRNWLPLETVSNAVIVRQTFLDRAAETPASMSIARIGDNLRPEPLSAERLQQGLVNAAAFVNSTAGVFADWTRSYLDHTNELPPADQAMCQRAGGDPNIFYYHSYWQIADDEALVIQVPRVPECRFWNLQLNNWWMESLDYRYHRIHLNQHSVRRDKDGGMTIVIAHRDPGHANWLETTGHDKGTMCMRWVGAQEPVHPTTRLVRFADLGAYLGKELSA